MPDAPLRCAFCGGPLGPHDRACASCGAARSAEAEAAPADADATIVDEATAGPASLPASEYNNTLRRLLGAEYELVEPIGEGGFARVYKVRDRRLDRIVAIKVIRPDVAGAASYVDSFRREGVALAKLRHPGIVPIYDIRESEGLIYYVMPFVEGETLGQKLDRVGRLAPSEAQRILTELCDALGAAHRAKMVHRDVKPANVILEGNLQKALLMDFGIAKAIAGDAESPAAGGPVVGTPAYMSPEQIAGFEEIDHRSDLYSLGVVGYRMLTGKLPFDGDSPKEILEKHITQQPVPIRRLNSSVPRNFANAIMRCLAKDPWDRFATAMDLWRDLESVSFFPTRTEEVATGSPSGTPVKIVAGITAIGLMAGFMAGRTVYRVPPAPPRPPAVAAQVLVSGWLDAAARWPRNGPAVDAAGDAVAAFEPEATVMYSTTAGGPSTVELAPPKLPSDPAIAMRMANVAENTLQVRTVGDVAIVFGRYGSPAPACGTVWFVLRARDTAWRMVHLRVQDTDTACESEARGPPNRE